MTTECKYNLLFMRDDSRVRRLRLSPFWLRLGAYLLALLALTAGLGVWGSVHFWQAARVLDEDKTSLERQLAEVRLRLERLENVEKLLKGGDGDDLKTIQRPVPGETKAPDKADKREPAPALPAVDLPALLAKVDLRQVSVDNLKAAMAEEQVKVAFDLNNLNQTPLAGQIVLWLVTNSGQQIKVSAPDPDLNFQIQRFKKVTVTFAMPKGFERKDFYALRVVVNGPSGVIFSETLPLASLLG